MIMPVFACTFLKKGNDTQVCGFMNLWVTTARITCLYTHRISQSELEVSPKMLLGVFFQSSYMALQSHLQE